jgi:hypothetical protein
VHGRFHHARLKRAGVYEQQAEGWRGREAEVFSRCLSPSLLIGRPVYSKLIADATYQRLQSGQGNSPIRPHFVHSGRSFGQVIHLMKEKNPCIHGFLLMYAEGNLVGAIGLEPTTPTMSRWCSNQLSYAPGIRWRILAEIDSPGQRCALQVEERRVRYRTEKRRALCVNGPIVEGCK